MKKKLKQIASAQEVWSKPGSTNGTRKAIDERICEADKF